MPGQGQGEVEICLISVGLHSLLQRGLKRSLSEFFISGWIGLQWAECLPGVHKALGSTPAPQKSGCGGAHL